MQENNFAICVEVEGSSNWFYTGKSGMQWLSPDVEHSYLMGRSEANLKKQAFSRSRDNLIFHVVQINQKGS